MKRIKDNNMECFFRRWAILVPLFLFPSFSRSQEAQVRAGESLFQNNCSSCHAISKAIIGPALAGITHKRPEEWLIKFIKNSQQVILSDDEYADFLYEKYNHTVMPSFRKLSATEIKSILTYIEQASLTGTTELTPTILEEKPHANHSVFNGYKNFNNLCSSCHSIGKEGYGPPLASITKRRPEEWLLKFINNPSAMIKGGDSYADFLYEKYDKKLMPGFHYLERETILNILKYIEHASESPSYVAGVNGRERNIAVGAPPVSAIQFPPINIHIDDDTEIFVKTFLIVTGVLSAIIHGMVIFKLLKYLARKNK